MKKTYYLFLWALALGTLNATEISLPNTGMEEWEKVRTPEKSLAEFPDGVTPAQWSAGGYRGNPSIPKCGVVSKDVQVKSNGSASLKLVCSDDRKTMKLQKWNLPVQGGKYYRLSCRMKGENIEFNERNKSAGPSLALISGPKKNFWGNQHGQYRRQNQKQNFEWQTFREIYAIPADDDSLMISIGFHQAKGTLWIDDIKLEESTESEYLEQQKQRITSKQEPTVWRGHYGPDHKQTFSLYCSDSKTPQPLLILIHGGGWLGGDTLEEADSGQHDGRIRKMNSKGIAVACINYRLGALPHPVLDAARAVQYLRNNAKKFNLNKEKFLATGFSAGATTSLWLALHDDLADPESKDPVARESTRLCGALAIAPQTSLYPGTLKKWKLEDATNHAMTYTPFGFPNRKTMLERFAEKKELYREYSPVTHVDKNDPEVMLVSRAPIDKSKDWIHHPRFVYEYKKISDQAGGKCIALLNQQDQPKIGEPRLRNEDGYILEKLLEK